MISVSACINEFRAVQKAVPQAFRSVRPSRNAMTTANDSKSENWIKDLI